MNWTWNRTIVRVGMMVPPKWRIPGGAMIVIAAFLVGTFVTEETAGNTRDNRAVSLFGLLVFIGVLWATSRNRKAIQWHTVIVGMMLQYVVALFVLRTGVGFDIFQFISGLARSLLGFAGEGTAFLTSPATAAVPWFLISVLPAIIFFVALVQMVGFCFHSSMFPSQVADPKIALPLGIRPMVHWKICCFLLLGDEGLWCGGCCRCCISFYRAR